MTFRLYLGIALCALLACKQKQVSTTRGAALPFLARDSIVVTNSGSDSLSVLNRKGTEVVSVSVDLDPSMHEAPHHVALDGKDAFIAMAFPAEEQQKKHGNHGRASVRGRVARLDAETLAVVEHAEVDENPGDIVKMHTREALLVTHFDMARALRAASKGEPPAAMFGSLQVWGSSPLVQKDARALCVAPHGMALTKDDSTLFVACYGSDELAIVNMSTLLVSKVAVGTSPGVLGSPSYGPYAATLSPDESLVAVSTIESGSIRWFNRRAGQFSHVRTLSGRAYMPAFVNATELIVPLQAPDGFARVSTLEILKSAPSDARCLRPHAVSRAPTGEFYAVCEGDHVASGTVVELDADTLGIKRVWTVGVYPDGLAFGNEPGLRR
jgi:DNA-binding beta-propeller fold protein YncE